MLLSPSPRGSFSVPVHINLHNVRRRRTRELLQYPGSVQDSQWRWSRSGEKTKAPAPVSSVGEERAMLLGFTMIAFSILMYFVVGIAVVKPCFHSEWGEATNCTLIQSELLNDDCNGLISLPCLQVFVNVTDFGRKALHYDETVVNINPECFYKPKSLQNREEQDKEAETIHNCISEKLGQTVRCHRSKGKHPGDVIMRKRYTLQLALYCLIWPSLMLFGGALLVGLVLLTQWLRHLCSEISAKEAGDGDGGVLAQGKLYNLLRCRPGALSVEQDLEI